MNKIRTPRNLNTYVTAEEAITQLNDMVMMLTDRARPGDVMRWDLDLHFHNPGWQNGSAPVPEHIVPRTTYHSGKPAPETAVTP